MTCEGLSAIDRRKFIAKSAVVASAAATFLSGTDRAEAQQAGAAIVLPALPYAQDALAPRFPKHDFIPLRQTYQAYVNNTLKMIAGLSLKSLARGYHQETAGKSDQTSLFNNAAQVFNHTFY